MPEDSWRAIGWTPDLADRRDRYRLLWVAPADFLDFVDPNFSPSKDSVAWLRKAALEGRSFAPLQVWARPRDIELLERGVVIPPPEDIRDHEGRHRAFVARELGVEQVPVAAWPRPDLKARLMPA